MSEISHEQRVCPVCQFIFEAGESRDGRVCLLDEQWLHAQAHVAVIECDAESSGLPVSQAVWFDVDTAQRTGRIDFLPRAKVAPLLGLQLAADKVCVFVSRPMLNWLWIVAR